MKKLLFSICILALAYNSHAGYRIYSGGNFAKFTAKNSQPRFAGVFGIDKTWDAEQQSFSIGVQYNVKSTLQQNNTMIFFMGEQGYYFDALFSVGYLEFPLMASVRSDANSKFRFGFSFGPSLAIALFDNSKWYNSTCFSSEGNPYYQHKLEDYYRESEDPGPFRLQSNAGFFLNAGFVVEYQNMYIELRYSHGVNKLGDLNGLQMNGEKFRTFEFVFGVHVENRR